MEVLSQPRSHWADEPHRAPLECGAIFHEIVERAERTIRTHRSGALAGKPDAVHTMRIELTKLRAATRFFKPWIVGTEWQQIEKELRRLNAALGKARNWDVTVEYAERKRYRYWAHKYRRSLLRSQDKAHRELREVLGSPKFQNLISTLHRWLDDQRASPKMGSRLPHRDNGYCETRLLAWRETLIKRGRCIDALSRKQLHRLRIKFKHYRYLIDSLLELNMAVSREDFTFYDTAKRLHKYLGEIRDLRRLRKHVRRWPPHYRKRKRELICLARRLLRSTQLS